MKTSCNSYNVRTDDYSVVKVYATVLVVLAHVTVFYSYQGGAIAMKPNDILNKITVFIYSFHMPLFVVLSGAIYHQCIVQGKYTNYKEFVIHKFKRLMIPYFVWGICYVAPVMVFLKITSLSAGQYIFRGIICNENSRHLWFLWTLFFLFVIVRLIQPIMDKRYSDVIIFAVFLILNYCSSRCPGVFGIRSILQYLVYFELGYIIDRRKQYIDKILKGRIYIAVAAFALIICLGIWGSGHYVVKIIMAFLGIIMSFGIIENLNKDLICQNRIYCMISRDSMEIYLAHPMIGYILFFCLGKYMINPYLFTVFVFFADIIGSFFIAEMLRKIKLHKT